MSLKHYCPKCHAFVLPSTQLCKACGESVLKEPLLNQQTKLEVHSRKNFRLDIWLFAVFIIGFAAFALKIFYEVMSGLAAGH
jgi:uncharacterized OB-fold protein